MSSTMTSDRGKRIPAYARDLIALQRTGRNVVWLCLALDWNLGRGWPRVVIPKDIKVEELDLRFVRGIDCMVAHYDNRARAFSISFLAQRMSAAMCPVFDVATGRLTTTADVFAACWDGGDDE